MKVIIEKRRSSPTERVPGQVRYRVQGALPFPVDMLRYDAAWPASEQDSLRIEATLRYGCADIEGPVTVDVYARQPLTASRWRSFGWVVDDVPQSSLETAKAQGRCRDPKCPDAGIVHYHSHRK